MDIGAINGGLMGFNGNSPARMGSIMDIQWVECCNNATWMLYGNDRYNPNRI